MYPDGILLASVVLASAVGPGLRTANGHLSNVTIPDKPKIALRLLSSSLAAARQGRVDCRAVRLRWQTVASTPATLRVTQVTLASGTTPCMRSSSVARAGPEREATARTGQLCGMRG
jgi:hypothetical protein